MEKCREGVAHRSNFELKKNKQASKKVCQSFHSNETLFLHFIWHCIIGLHEERLNDCRHRSSFIMIGATRQ
jgi:hypothetical protein